MDCLSAWAIPFLQTCCLFSVRLFKETRFGLCHSDYKLSMKRCNQQGLVALCDSPCCHKEVCL